MSELVVDTIPKGVDSVEVRNYLIGKKVIALQNGSKLGSVKDAFVSGDFARLVGLSLGSEGMFRKKQSFVPIDRVIALGTDFVIVHSPEDISSKDGPPIPSEWLAWSQFRGRTAIGHGIKLAILNDIVIGGDLEVCGLVFSKVLTDCSIKPNKIIPVSILVDHGGPQSQEIKVDLDLI